MIALVKQAILSLRNLLGGATAVITGGITDTIPTGVLDNGVITQVTELAGFSIPAFILYYIFLDD